MKNSTIHALLQLNQNFYQSVAESFNQTRQNDQPGWELLVKSLAPPPNRPLTVLDIGCGNGRFGTFLNKHLQCPLAYTGIDRNETLLTEAKKRLVTLDAVNLEKQEITELHLTTTFDVVVAFGVMHHLPGFETRLKCLENWSTFVKPGGMMAVSFWHFDQDTRIMQKRVQPPQLFPDLEPGDYFLPWQDSLSIRYCHLTSNRELENLKNQVPLRIHEIYQADGKQGDLATYIVWLK